MAHAPYEGFPGSSAGKEFACNAGDPGSVSRSGRSPGEGIGYPLQYSWASLVAQSVKNLPAMWETQVRSLGQEDLLEKGMATHSSLLAWKIPMDRGAWWATVHGVAKSRTQLSSKHRTAQHAPYDTIFLLEYLYPWVSKKQTCHQKYLQIAK